MCLRLGIVSEAGCGSDSGKRPQKNCDTQPAVIWKRLFWLRADIIRLFWAQTLLKTFMEMFQSINLKLESCLVYLSQVDPAIKAASSGIISPQAGFLER